MTLYAVIGVVVLAVTIFAGITLRVSGRSRSIGEDVRRIGRDVRRLERAHMSHRSFLYPVYGLEESPPNDPGKLCGGKSLNEYGDSELKAEVRRREEGEKRKEALEIIESGIVRNIKTDTRFGGCVRHIEVLIPDEEA